MMGGGIITSRLCDAGRPTIFKKEITFLTGMTQSIPGKPHLS